MHYAVSQNDKNNLQAIAGYFLGNYIQFYTK